MSNKRKKFYAIARGFETGIFTEWSGERGAQNQVKDYKNALYQGFYTRKEAEDWLLKQTQPSKIPSVEKPKANQVIIYTDGGALNNPGPGGYGVVIFSKNKRKEISGGYQKTTNNRMELLACIKGLQNFKESISITLYTDSKYVVNGITKGWARKWQKNNWYRNKIEKAENVDLWSKLLELTAFYQVTFQWIKGHSGIIENERCDQLVQEEMTKENLPPDQNYQNKQTQIPIFNL